MSTIQSAPLEETAALAAQLKNAKLTVDSFSSGATVGSKGFSRQEIRAAVRQLNILTAELDQPKHFENLRNGGARRIIQLDKSGLSKFQEYKAHKAEVLASGKAKLRQANQKATATKRDATAQQIVADLKAGAAAHKAEAAQKLLTAAKVHKGVSKFQAAFRAKQEAKAIAIQQAELATQKAEARFEAAKAQFEQARLEAKAAHREKVLAKAGNILAQGKGETAVSKLQAAFRAKQEAKAEAAQKLLTAAKAHKGVSRIQAAFRAQQAARAQQEAFLASIRAGTALRHRDLPGDTRVDDAKADIKARHDALVASAKAKLQAGVHNRKVSNFFAKLKLHRIAHQNGKILDRIRAESKAQARRRRTGFTISGLLSAAIVAIGTLGQQSIHSHSGNSSLPVCEASRFAQKYSESLDTTLDIQGKLQDKISDASAPHLGSDQLVGFDTRGGTSTNGTIAGLHDVSQTALETDAALRAYFRSLI